MKLDSPVIGILRGIEPVFFAEVMEASFNAGLSAMEITMNTHDAAGIISRCRPNVPPGKWLGAGTVRNLDEAKEASDAGAMFFVTPNTNVSVITYALDHNIPVVAGAFTPTEVYAAWEAGAEMVKVFPCGMLGPQYIRDLKGPFEQIPMVAVGGVNLHNVGDYFKAGVEAVGVGASLFGKKALAERDITALKKNVSLFTRCCIENLNHEQGSLSSGEPARIL
jgi:2-dehydro-3-deoxyphosphogluconate aldolase / (4S)-4-hydroxy-2-oxoglutarate aldolase